MCNQISNQIFADQNITSTQKIILLSLSRYSRDDDPRCYRSIENLVRDTKLSRRCVIKTLKDLKAKGILIPIESQTGFQTKSTVYMINRSNLNEGARGAPMSAPDAPIKDKKPSSGGAPRAPHIRDIDYNNIYISNKTVPEENSQEPPPISNAETRTKFEEWWAAYPRKQGKEKAYEAYCKALAQTDAGTLLRKAKSYAKYREKATQDKPEQMFYTKIPQNWLRDGLWEDHYGAYEVEEKVQVPEGFKGYKPYKPTFTQRGPLTEEERGWNLRLLEAGRLSDEEYSKFKKEYDAFWERRKREKLAEAA